MDKVGIRIRAREVVSFFFGIEWINWLHIRTSILTKKRKEQILAALQNGGKPVINPTKQSGGFLVTLLVSILIPLLLNALTGKGIQNRSRPSRPVPRTSLS